MRIAISALLSLLIAALPAAGQGYAAAFEGRHAAEGPQVRYVIRVNPAALTGYDVEMVVRQSPETLRVAIPVWAPGAYRIANFARNVRGLSLAVGGRPVPLSLVDSSTWRAVVPAGSEATIRYRVEYPSRDAAMAPNNRGFVSPTGGLIDGPQAFAYIDGYKELPVHVQFLLPAGWRIATGLVPTSDPQVFFAPSYDVLIDSPVMIGRFRSWRFSVDGIPHRVAFWSAPGSPAFDSTRFVASIRRGVELARDVMRSLPYREYTFLYVDGPGGGLEHLNSTTIGIRAKQLRDDPLAALDVTYHEFFHLWNVKRIRPVALGPFDYQHEVRTNELWWSEGVTDYFAAELARRSGYKTEQQALADLQSAVASYVSNPAVGAISPQRSSWTAWDSPAVNRGLSLSYYLQGRLLGELLEVRLRNQTGLQRGMDDVIRLMYARHAGEKGFTGDELRAAATEVCGCDLSAFWKTFVEDGQPLNFDRGLDPLGYQLIARATGAMTKEGHAAADLRIGVLSQSGYGSAGGIAGGRLRLSVSSPFTAWGAAGLQTGDELVRFAGRELRTADEFRAALAKVRIGDTVTVEVLRAGKPVTARAVITGYDQVDARLVELPQLTESQRAMRRVWMTGRP